VLDDRAVGARLLGYWYDCVADEADALAAGERAAALPEFELAAVAAGRIPASVVNALPAQDPAAPLPVLVAVGRLSPKRRAVAPDGSEAFVPLWIPALLTRAGELRPDERRHPFLTRALLEPTAVAISIGRLDDAAEFYARKETALGSWRASWAWAMALWRAVVKEPLAQYVPAAWRFDAVARVVACESDGRSHAPLAIVDGARERIERASVLPLFERFAAGDASPADAAAEQSGHLGDEPLSADQRFALRRALALRDGDSLAIAAPPGTGAIALVRSLVASLVVDSVARAARPLDAVPPLVALLAPGNEEAARWVDASSRDDGGTASGHRRWIAQTDGYAVHLTAGDGEASPADRGHPKLPHRCAPSAEGGVADPVLAAERERSYLDSFALTYGHAAPSLDDALARLQAMTRDWRARLEADSRACERYAQLVPRGTDRATARARIAAPLDAAVGTAARELEAFDENRAHAARSAADSLQRYDGALSALAPRSLYERAFSWLASVEQHRRRRFAAALGVAPPADPKDFHSLQAWVEERRAIERARTIRADSKREALAQRLERAQAERAAALQAFDATANALDALAELAAAHGIELAQRAAAAEAPEELFDRLHRSEAFRCAARFWEGRRLRELARPDDARDSSGSERVLRRLRSIAMLHPVAVATLPALAAWYAADDAGTPLYAALDELVVVEAEQVDVARGALALPLAKRLLALGDPHGRDPLVQLEEARSRAKLHERFGDLAPWTHLQERGLLSYDRSAASLLRALPARVSLTAQRRGAPELVACCEELAHPGLHAIREAPARGSLPVLGYAHVRGRGEPRGASRVNEAEARIIVQFLIERREELLRTYPEAKCLADAVAILTPFAAQASFIAERLAEALRACHLRAEPDLAPRTPFRQGTAVPVVLYSHVLEPGEENALVDARPNLLALALLRASEHFVFFGDVRGLAQRPPDSPSGVLAKHLLASPANRLEGLPASFYGPDAELAAVDTLENHLALLDEALAGAAERLTIVSPLAGHGLPSDATLHRLPEIARRGIRVSIVSDCEIADGGVPLAASLRAHSIEWCVAGTIFASALAVDGSALYEGSFAWLGAPGPSRAGKGWLARGPGAARAADELRRYYASA